MIQTIIFVTDALAYATVFGHILIAFLLVFFTYSICTSTNSKFYQFLSKNSLLLAMFVSLSSIAASLFYSEYAGYEPCELCWYQRIFMYPQFFLLTYGIIKKDKNVSRYSLLLAIIGGLIAIYHYIVQMLTTHNINVESLVPCSAVGGAPSCTEFYIFKFGYITIPLMSLTAFVLLILALAPNFIKKIKN